MSKLTDANGIQMKSEHAGTIIGCIVVAFVVTVFYGIPLLLAKINESQITSVQTKDALPEPVPFSTVLTPEKQTQREEWIAEAIDQGILTDVEMPGTEAHIFVDKKFYGLTIQKKNSLANFVYAYYYNKDHEMTWVTLFDGYSGRMIGTYDKYGGLRLE